MAIEQAVAGESDGTHVYGLGEGPVVNVQIYQVPTLTDGVVLDNPVLPEEPVVEPAPVVKTATTTTTKTTTTTTTTK